MKRRQFIVLAVLVIISGFLGGAVTSWFLMGQPAFAQKYGARAFQFAHPDSLGNPRFFPGGPKVVIAEEFILINPEGHPRARLYVDGYGQGQLDLLPNVRKLTR